MNDQDRSLIQKAQNGDSEAFRELIDLYSPRIYRIAYQTAGNSEDARDIAQEVFLRLYRKLDTFGHTTKFTTWLYRMTVNLSIDYLRKNSGRRNVSIDEFEHTLEIPDSGGLPDAHAEHNELKGVISRLAVNLTPKQRKVFVLRDLQDFSTAEIADILKCSNITVRVHLSSARRAIKKALMKHYPNLVTRNTSGGEYI
ncbi:RNA polymerase sigma factor [Candidatus Latescibacterota bacterium]